MDAFGGGDDSADDLTQSICGIVTEGSAIDFARAVVTAAGQPRWPEMKLAEIELTLGPTKLKRDMFAVCAHRHAIMRIVDFLTLALTPERRGIGSARVICVAQSCDYIKFVAGLFPDARFLVVAPADVSNCASYAPSPTCDSKGIAAIIGKRELAKGGSAGRPFILQTNMTDAVLRGIVLARDKLGKGPVCFISDMPGTMYDEHETWLRELSPDAYTIPFVYPNADNFEYIAGRVMLYPWAPADVTTIMSLAGYDGTRVPFMSRAEYNGKLTYHNCVRRQFVVHRTMQGENDQHVLHTDCCADCATEHFIWNTYIKHIADRGKKATAKTVPGYMIEACDNITLGKSWKFGVGFHGRFTQPWTQAAFEELAKLGDPGVQPIKVRDAIGRIMSGCADDGKV